MSTEPENKILFSIAIFPKEAEKSAKSKDLSRADGGKDGGKGEVEGLW